MIEAATSQKLGLKYRPNILLKLDTVSKPIYFGGAYAFLSFEDKHNKVHSKRVLCALAGPDHPHKQIVGWDFIRCAKPWHVADDIIDICLDDSECGKRDQLSLDFDKEC